VVDPLRRPDIVWLLYDMAVAIHDRGDGRRHEVTTSLVDSTLRSPPVAALSSQSHRSGCSRTMRANSGWNWNQPTASVPTWAWVVRACSGEMGMTVPAALARSCAWHDRSIVTNHQIADSTVCPTVNRPWLARMTAFVS